MKQLMLQFVWLLGFVAMLTGQSAALAAGQTKKAAALVSPVIHSFTASSTTINKGDSVTLNWQIDNGPVLWISGQPSPDPGDVRGKTSTVVKPSVTTKYIMAAWNFDGPGGQVFADVTVNVIQPVPAKITSFTATPATVKSGDPVTLNWAATNATGFSVAPGVGTVTGNSVTVNPTANTTYTLTANSPNGNATKTVAVKIAALPVITSFAAAPASVTTGTSTKLSWAVTDATSLSISPAPGTVTGTSVSVTPTADTTYVLTATSAAGSVTQSVPVKVTAAAVPKPTIGSFGASPASIPAGSSATLNWSITGADTVSIAPGVGTVTGSSVSVSPTATTTYTVTATNASGSVTKNAKVTISASAPPPPPPVPVISSFAPTPNFINPGDSATLTWAVSGADSVSISPAVGTVTGNSVAVKPAATTIYTLTATNANGSSTQSTLVGVATAGGGVSHPRAWLTPPLVATLSQRAAANDAAWIKLRNECDTLATYKVLFPDGGQYVDNTINGEYEFSGYIDPAISLGLCYQVAKNVDSTRAAKYGAKEKELLLALSDPTHHGAPTVDDGYGIRHYVPALSLGYDWIYDLLSPAERAQIYTEINRWIASYEKVGFGREFPQGNYFAGYYFALATAAVTTEGDNPQAAALWDDWYNRIHLGQVQPYYNKWLAGGGVPDGWNYGPLLTLNMSRALLAVSTAKGIDFIHDSAHPMTYADGHAKWMTQMTWPNGKTINDRGFLYTNSPNRPPSDVSGDWATEFNGLLQALHGDNSAIMQQYTADVRVFSKNSSNWVEFLYWNPSAPAANYKTDLSYRTGGDGQAVFRSDWTSNAVWGAFQAGPYTGYDGSGEEFFDEGSLVIQRGQYQFIVNAVGALTTPTPGTQDATDPTWTEIYNDVWSQTIDGASNPRRNFNTYHSKGSANGMFGQNENGTGSAKTTLSLFEDHGSFIMMRGSKLEDMYNSGNGITAWSRDVAFLRPKLFVVYDRTTTSSKATDDWMAWHTVPFPTQSPAGNGSTRVDVVDTRAVYGGNLFRGRMTTVLPANNVVKFVNIVDDKGVPQNKAYRMEVRRPTTGAGSATWLTVFDASDSAASAAGTVSPINLANNNVLSGDVEGTLISGTAGNNVVLFSKSGNAVTGTVSVSLPVAATYTLVTSLQPNVGYSVTSSVVNGALVLNVAQGGGFTTTPQGNLAINVSATGAVTAAQ
ncbi:MAG TPA: hypothetical protein VH105_26225 [Burkholderiales bacterium]|nr:hypothetical protein [Burkholderiales bacterium]